MLSSAAPAQRQVAVHRGNSAGDQFGHSMSRAGDVNGDGTPDWMAGVRSAPVGYVKVLSGDGRLLHEISEPLPAFGYVVAPAMDLNLDGFDDLLLMAGFEGRVYSGLDGSLLQSYLLPRSAGACAAIGDVDGDGHPDYAFGSSSDDLGHGFGQFGSVTLFSGNTGTQLYKLVGENTTDQLGASLASTEDLDGDGRPELLAGATRSRTTFGHEVGRVRVYSGATGALFFSFPGSARGEQFGYSLAAVGDVNGDGWEDHIVGAPCGASGCSAPGKAYVFSLQWGGFLHVLDGPVGARRFGASVGAAGDVDGDGLDDVIVGAPGGTLQSSWIYSGKDGSLLYAQRGFGEYGRSVTGIGDVDGDGAPEWIVADRLDDSVGTDAGAVFLYSPVTLSVDNLVAGQDATFSATNLDPNQFAVLAASDQGFGKTALPDQGVALILDAATQLAGPRRSDARGTVSWKLAVPMALQGEELGFQVLQPGLTTNAVFATVQ